MVTVELSSVAEVQMGTAPAGSSYNNSGEGVPLIAGAGDYGERYPVSKKWTTAATRLTKPGDLIVCVRATIGDLNWADREYCLGRGVAGVRPDPDRLNCDYLAQYMGFAKSALAKLGTGSTFPAIRRADLDTFPIPLPPLSEQKRIAEILDRAEALRAKRRAALALLDELTQSIFLDMFGDPAVNANGYPEAQLYSLIRENDRLNYGVVQPGDDVKEGGVPLVRVGDLGEGKIRCENLKRISESIESAYKRSRLQGDEILISCVGSIGEIALVDSSQKGFNIARAVARVSLADGVIREYVAEHLRSHHIQRYFKSELRTVSQPTLNIKQIGETKILLPPLSLQVEFSSRHAEVERLIGIVSESAAELDQLFASLQHRAFQGEL